MDAFVCVCVCVCMTNFCADEEGRECREAKETRVSVETSKRVARDREESELRVASLASLAIKKIV